jgi:hypothetical protein
VRQRTLQGAEKPHEVTKFVQQHTPAPALKGAALPRIA